MSIWISGIFGSLLSNFSYCYLFTCIEKGKKFSFKGAILCILFAICTGYTIYFNGILRSVIMIISITLLFKIIFKQQWSKILITTFLIHILFALSESIFVVFCLYALKMDAVMLTGTSAGIFFTNVGITIVVIFLMHQKKIKQMMCSVIEWYENKSTLNLIVTILIACATLLFLLYQNLNGINDILNFVFNNIFIIGVVYFVVCFFVEKSANTKISNEYNHLMNYVKTYETEIISKSKWQHEYENQLIIIKDKIEPENKKAIRYIDKLLKNKPKSQNSQWLIKLSKFPDIGIKGLLHYKICQMIKNGINVYVDVINEDLIPSTLPSQLLEDNLQDISMALGVYLDNAMQASMESDNKYLIVEFKCNSEAIIFEISNTYKGTIQLDKINQERFTSKGKGHGYGLSLVKDILEKNPLLSQEREMNGIYFVQRLIINIK